MNDERKFPRLNENWQITYRILENEKILKNPLYNSTVNISGGGLSFRAEKEIIPKTLLAIELKSEEFPSQILAMARVVWCKASQHEYELGAEFWWIGWRDNDAQQAIANHIASAIETEGEG